MTEETERFMVDDAGTLIDKKTAQCYDYMEEIVNLMNSQEEQIQELKQRNQRQYERLKELTDLMFARDWKTLELMVDKWEKEEEYLQKYGG